MSTARARMGTDAQGRSFRDEWGWLGAANHPKRRSVRQITLQRLGETDVVLVTDLLEADRYPAVELLDHYLQRWGIEQVFQKVTEVFHLQGLIGSTPKATIFQFAFCLVLYNLIPSNAMPEFWNGIRSPRDDVHHSYGE